MIAAREGAQVVMVSRDPKRGERALRSVRAAGSGDVSLELADLASLASVRDLAGRLRNRLGHVDALINNAGILSARRQVTTDGFERTMATNYLGPFLLTHLLKERLAEARGRIVNVSSDGHRSGDLRRAPIEDVLRGRAWNGMMGAYADSKLANILFTFEWMRSAPVPGVIANALHPGVLRTRIWNQNWHPLSLFMQPFRILMGSAQRGGHAVLRLAQPGVADRGGKYFDKGREARAVDQAYDERLAAELWETSTRLCRPSARPPT